ncbi:MAG: hypothetical protein ACK4NR_03795 [Micavibrio sp.]
MEDNRVQRLDRLCEELENLRDRFDRRSKQNWSSITDAYMNGLMLRGVSSAFSVLSRLCSFFHHHADQKGALPLTVRDEYFDLIVETSTEACALRSLANKNMNRVGSAPGALGRLSPYFLSVVLREREEIVKLETGLTAGIREDIEILKTMPRAGNRKLRLVHSV